MVFESKDKYKPYFFVSLVRPPVCFLCNTNHLNNLVCLVREDVWHCWLHDIIYCKFELYSTYSNCTYMNIACKTSYMHCCHTMLACTKLAFTSPIDMHQPRPWALLERLVFGDDKHKHFEFVTGSRDRSTSDAPRGSCPQPCSGRACSTTNRPDPSDSTPSPNSHPHLSSHHSCSHLCHSAISSPVVQSPGGHG